ncbi:MAG: hypothetical protein WC340_16800, partial [Kiritimatiellia bacterium]
MSAPVGGRHRGPATVVPLRGMALGWQPLQASPGVKHCSAPTAQKQPLAVEVRRIMLGATGGRPWSRTVVLCRGGPVCPPLLV